MVIERRGPVRARRPAGLRRLSIATAALLALTPGTTAWSQSRTQVQQPQQAPAPGQVPQPPAPNQLPMPPQAQAAAPAPAPQPAWVIEPRLNATVIGTDNSGYSSPGGESDQVLDLTPRLRVTGRGLRTELDADIGVHVLQYLQDTRDGRVLPDARAQLNSTLIDRWAYLDARLVAEQTSADPFLGRPDLSTSVNRITTTRLRLSPYLDHRFSPSVSMQARSDNAWTRRGGEYDPTDPRRDAFEQRNFLRLAQQSPRLGLAGELQQFDARYSGTGEVLSTNAARGIVSFGFGPQIQLGLVAGRERARFSGIESEESVYGLRGLWLPTERTNLRASVEKRFFGTGWEAQFTHRSPLWALQFRSFREPTALPASQVLSPQSTDVATLLDAILTTRHPDPVQRRALVRSMIDSLNLPEILERPVEVYSDRAQLQTGSSASFALLGRRTTASVTVQSLRLEQLRDEDGLSTPLPSTLQLDNKQRGIGVDVRHRVAPQTTLGARARASRIEGVTVAGQTTEKTLQLSLTHSLSQRAAVTVGVRRQMLDSTVRADARENAVFVGLSQRF